MNRPGSVETLRCPGVAWRRGLGVQATRLLVSSLELSRPNRECGRWRLWKIVLASSTWVRQFCRSRSSTCSRLQNDSMTALSKQLPTEPIGQQARVEGAPGERPRGWPGSAPPDHRSTAKVGRPTNGVAPTSSGTSSPTTARTGSDSAMLGSRRLSPRKSTTSPAPTSGASLTIGPGPGSSTGLDQVRTNASTVQTAIVT